MTSFENGHFLNETTDPQGGTDGHGFHLLAEPGGLLDWLIAECSPITASRSNLVLEGACKHLISVNLHKVDPVKIWSTCAPGAGPIVAAMGPEKDAARATGIGHPVIGREISAEIKLMATKSMHESLLHVQQRFVIEILG